MRVIVRCRRSTSSGRTCQPTGRWSTRSKTLS
jgi:hypothetical protein